MHQLILVWFGLVKSWGYAGIIALMAMESSIFPVPSEVVIPPAAFLSTQGHMSFWGIIAAGTFGSWLGSAITYWVTRAFGRLVIVKWGRFFLISEEKLTRAERFVHRYEAGGIFFARLLPVIRHLISIPAGLVRMDFRIFSTMTVIGSFMWCTVLAWFGTTAITQEMMENPDAMVHAVKAKSLPLVLFVALFCVLYLVVIRLTAKPVETTVTPAS